MSVDLSNYVETLKREVTPPGSTLFADVGEDTWIGYLADAFWEARLDGFLSSWEASEDGIVTPSEVGGDDMPRDSVALVVLYAGIKVLRNRILNINTGFRAKAGPVEYETQNSATVLAEMLKQLQGVKDRLLKARDDALNVNGTTTLLVDGYSVRQWTSDAYYGDLLAGLYAGVS